MIAYKNNKSKGFAFINGQYVKLKKGHICDGGEFKKIYSAGSTVTYYVDADVSYTEEVDSDASCLSPLTFTPAKDGWEFIGWREDATADSTVLTSKVMGDEPIALYAVYRKLVTLRTVSNGTTSARADYRYYNASGEVTSPTFTIASPTRIGWTFLGWSTSAKNTTVTYESISNLYREEDITLYAVWNNSDVSGTVNLNYNPSSQLYTGAETQATILSGVDTSKYSAVQFTFASGNIHISVDYRGTQLDMFVSDGVNKTRIGYAYSDWSDPAIQYNNQGIVLAPTLTFASNSGTKSVLLTSECHTYNSTASTSSTGFVYVMGVAYKLIGRTTIY